MQDLSPALNTLSGCLVLRDQNPSLESVIWKLSDVLLCIMSGCFDSLMLPQVAP